MFRRFLCSSSILASVCFPYDADAQRFTPWGGPTSNGVINCPQPVDGGCAASPGGTFIIANFSTYARQSGQTWINNHPWNWNQCAIDYGCGPWTPKANEKDPSTINTYVPQCVFSATGSTSGGAIVNCNDNGNPTNIIDAVDNVGFDFSLHNCTPLHFSSGYSQKITIYDSYFDAISTASNNCTTQSGGNGSYLIFGDNLNFADLDLESINVNGEKNTGLNNCIGDWTQGQITGHYNVIRFCDNQPIVDGATNGNNVDIETSYGEGFVYTSGVHGELWIRSFSPSSPTVPLMKAAYTLVLQDSDNKVSGSTACYYMTSGNVGGAITTVILDHTICIANLNGGQSTTSQAMEIGGPAYTNETLNGNWVDDTGLLGDWSALSGSCVNPAVFTNNKRLTDGSSINAWTNNTATGC